MTLAAFIHSLDLNPDTIVAECEGRIIKRDEYDTLVLQEGNVLELIRFVGGG
jgi:sulfur carrier protein